MMDYEYRILLLEKDLAHAREMQQIMRGRMDTHDTGFEHLKNGMIDARERLDRIEINVEAISTKMDALTDNVNKLTNTVNSLVTALLREHPNGH